MRRLLTTAAVLAVVAVTAPAHASFVAQPGYYAGFSGGVPVHFHYDHGKITNFSVDNHIRIPEMAVVHAAFDGSFGHRHLLGGWNTATHVEGDYSYLRDVRGRFIRQHISWTATWKHH
jgi:hypothetical protein